jgi:sec-independent protein translocase protein TatC
MATAVRPPSLEEGMEDRAAAALGQVKSRLTKAFIGVALAFVLCFWQQDFVLQTVNRPFETAQDTIAARGAPGGDGGALQQAARFNAEVGGALRSVGPALTSVGVSLEQLADAEGVSPAERARVAQAVARIEVAVAALREAAAAVPTDTERRPVTLGVAEPFTTTLSVALYGALLLSLPLLIYQGAALLVPLLPRPSRTIVVPLLALSPVLFVGGVLFSYYQVLPRALAFLQGFNDAEFDTLLRARDYYSLSTLLMGATGVLFMLPVVILGVTRTGLVTPRQLRDGRGYAILALAVITAVVTPTPDPITMLLLMVPLVVLYELSILLATWVDRLRPPSEDADGPGADPPAPEAKDL